MNYNLSIIIAHYYPDINQNPLFKTIKTINDQLHINSVEVIIADDGSRYSKNILNNYSNKINISNDERCFYTLEGEKLDNFLSEINIESRFIKKWIYLPKNKQCMSKARVVNEAVRLSKSKNLFFLDDDNYLMNANSLNNLINLLNEYDFVVGQIQDKSGNLRTYNSNRVQGTTIAIKSDIFNKIGGFGTWTENYSCGIDSDFWIKVYSHFQTNKKLKACYAEDIKTCDSYSKRWKKYTKFFKEIRLKYKFYKLYNCKNYKSSKYNLSRNKKIWIENLINEY
tara:strand:- start:3710 stop:4555 length:846 start_codon:yes stop_codon:yes gene_type:complete